VSGLFGSGAGRSFLDPAMLARLSALPLLARRPMQGSVSGRHMSVARGSSIEFAEYRKYVPGDDLRRLDWRAFGRSDRFYVKEYEADTNLRLVVVLDTSGSMDFGSVGRSKLAFARVLAGSLAYLASQQGDAVGLACVSQGLLKSVPPRRSPAHLRGVLDALQQAEPQGTTGLVSVLHELAETVRQRALVVIVSDFFTPPEELKGALEHLRFRRHDCTALQLLDPEEMAFEFRRPTRFVDLEGGEALLVDPTQIADRYQRALQQYLIDLQRVMLETEVDYHRILIDQDEEMVLRRLLIGRMAGRGGR